MKRTRVFLDDEEARAAKHVRWDTYTWVSLSAPLFGFRPAILDIALLNGVTSYIALRRTCHSFNNLLDPYLEGQAARLLPDLYTIYLNSLNGGDINDPVFLSSQRDYLQTLNEHKESYYLTSVQRCERRFIKHLLVFKPLTEDVFWTLWIDLLRSQPCTHEPSTHYKTSCECCKKMFCGTHSTESICNSCASQCAYSDEIVTCSLCPKQIYHCFNRFASCSICLNVFCKSCVTTKLSCEDFYAFSSCGTCHHCNSP